MRFLADESVERPVVNRLSEAGYDLACIADVDPGASDAAVLRRANRDRRVLITNDKDFAVLAFLQRHASSGIILLRMPRSRSGRKADRLLEVLREAADRLRNVMTVVEETSARRRPFRARRPLRLRRRG